MLKWQEILWNDTLFLCCSDNAILNINTSEQAIVCVCERERERERERDCVTVYNQFIILKIDLSFS
jgi:hypothetical protein